MKKLFILFIAVAGFGVSSYAQSSVNTAGSSTATIVKAITVTPVEPLSFGRIVNTSGGTMEINSAGTVTASAGLLKATGGIAASRASFNVVGEPETTVTISVPNNEVVLTHTNGTDVMSVTGIDCTEGTTSALPITTGAVTLHLFGTLTVLSDSPSGTYSNIADLQITVNYQ